MLAENKKATCGREKNSDCVVEVELTNDRINIDINSKIKNLFGKQMEKAVRDVLEEFDVKGANVTVRDFGALDFVIKARTKTALRQALKEVQ
ncbi:citrate lyase subunit gamma (acyl carrier protein) [Dethiosulfatibacter aminovorans DSM 17477]|uniref:Citrate lyase subunit gamma (Acyl carrier protein) n=1 Tax=Dethiosulfatibacter aminovorans DSM 17477 TaxID=1121476 RepID=A0A1M6GP88_9FIRM|nr:citrate lyase acyl carrier protein [Dethiosulfatibacter aminovorans]SHJ11749.1 citrate lyase subunit gamma (acyl carrier protein) [Dethiosulfatibacter aminovorans DSM 17477]